MAFPNGSVDPVDTVAVERAVRGERTDWTLTPAEIQYAAPFMFDLVPYSVVCSRLGISATSLKKLFPEVGPRSERAAHSGPRAKRPAQCGTRRGYHAHKSGKEVACGSCKSANAAADRHYRLHGTYQGAPEVAA
ncbi:hypothetical protein [Streptomyces sp. NPDC046821]|uniref:hypothetical protein n=1 Tax=Streptomyces sp. NPDC046821 TaxID=3154702 RepID=UPI003406D161